MPAAAAPAATRPSAGPQLKTRQPTGEIGLPLILLAGGEKAGKSLVPVVLSRSERVGMTYWIDLGEGAADEYASLPESRYLVIDHDGTYRDILEQVTAVWHEAQRAHEAGEPPVVLVVDSASAEWTMLVNWTNDRARRSRAGQRTLAQDPDAEVDPTPNLWNDANKRHYRLMNLLMTFPGIAIVTARGKEVTEFDSSGTPTKNKLRAPEGQKGLAHDVDCWIWMEREPRTAELMGVRSLRVSTGDPLPTTKVGPGWEVLDLDAFIFDVLGATGPKQGDSLKQLRGDELEGVLDLIATCNTEEGLQAIWNRVKEGLTPNQHDELAAIITQRLTTIREYAAWVAEGKPEDPEEGKLPADPEEPSLGSHGPSSDAEKLRQAAEARRAAHDGGGDAGGQS